MNTLPEGWTTKTLGEILPEAAVGPVKLVVDGIKAGRVQYPHPAFVAALDPYRDDLLAKGVLVEYLAYVLEAAVLRDEL